MLSGPPWVAVRVFHDVTAEDLGVALVPWPVELGDEIAVDGHSWPLEVVDLPSLTSAVGAPPPSTRVATIATRKSAVLTVATVATRGLSSALSARASAAPACKLRVSNASPNSAVPVTICGLDSATDLVSLSTLRMHTSLSVSDAQCMVSAGRARVADRRRSPLVILV
jgi:hypothetical protein